MKIKYEFKTKAEATKYLLDRGWIQNGVVFSNPNNLYSRMVHPINRKWYIGIVVN